MIRSDPLTKRPIHKLIDLTPGCWSEVVPAGIFVQIEFRPYHQMHNRLVDPIWPVIIKDLDIV